MKINKLWIVSLVILFTILQCSLLSGMQIFNIHPDILLILIVFFSLYFGKIYGLVIGAVCGAFNEITSGVPAGLAVSVYSLGGLILGYIGRWVFNQTIRGEFTITFIFTFIIYSTFFFLMQIFNPNLSLLNTLIFLILPASVYTAAISPLLLRFLRFLINLEI